MFALQFLELGDSVFSLGTVGVFEVFGILDF